MTETISKIYKPTTYEEVIKDLIHRRKWQKTIEEKLQNLEDYYIWEYKELLLGHKAISSKSIFKMKYYSNKATTKFKA